MRNARGTMKIFFSMLYDDYREMDHKLLKILAGIVYLVISAILWLYFRKLF